MLLSCSFFLLGFLFSNLLSFDLLSPFDFLLSLRFLVPVYFLGDLFIFFFLLFWRFHAKLFVLNKQRNTYLDSFFVSLTSLEIYGSILILFSDSSNTLMAFIHSFLLFLISYGYVNFSLPHSGALLVCSHHW